MKFIYRMGVCGNLALIKSGVAILRCLNPLIV